MNLAIRGIKADIGKEHADTFRHIPHSDLRADCVLAKPPFNDSDRFRKDDDALGYYMYNRALNAHTEILHFEKIVVDAKRRHKAFFEKLEIG